jgi:diaminopimelate epimerase
MDYRNSDGSLAEMCGNGVRVFARYLVDSGLAEPGAWSLATRSGLRHVTVGASPSSEVSVDMGPPELLGRGSATVADNPYEGWRISMGNPHLACRITTPVSALDLTRPPTFDPGLFPTGVNVELFRPVGEHHVEMRVYERGSGETRSCGTGAVATAVAAALADASPHDAYALTAGVIPRGEWQVDVLGGRLTVTLDGSTSHLRGPAVLVAEGEIRKDWLTT